MTSSTSYKRRNDVTLCNYVKLAIDVNKGVCCGLEIFLVVYQLVEYVNDNNYAEFYDPSYHRYSERHLSVFS